MLLLSYIHEIDHLYLLFTRSLVGYFIVYIAPIIFGAYMGRIIQTRKKLNGIIGFMAALIIVHTFFIRLELQNFVQHVLYVTVTWGYAFQDRIFTKLVLLTSLTLAVLNVLLVEFLYNPLISVLSTKLSANVLVYVGSLSSILGTLLFYLIIHRFIPSKTKVADFLLAFILFFVMPF